MPHTSHLVRPVSEHNPFLSIDDIQDRQAEIQHFGLEDYVWKGNHNTQAVRVLLNNSLLHCLLKIQDNICDCAVTIQGH